MCYRVSRNTTPSSKYGDDHDPCKNNDRAQQSNAAHFFLEKPPTCKSAKDHAHFPNRTGITQWGNRKRKDCHQISQHTQNTSQRHTDGLTGEHTLYFCPTVLTKDQWRNGDGHERKHRHHIRQRKTIADGSAVNGGVDRDQERNKDSDCRTLEV